MSSSPFCTRWLLLLALGCGTSSPAPTDGPTRSVTLPVSGSPAVTASEPEVAPAAASAPQAPRPTFAQHHPRAAWRLAHPAELNAVVLWVDQILIRHDDARDEVSFNLADWSSVPPRPARSRDAALELARDVASQAARDPAGFAELARRYSEDLPSRDEGGALGGLSASELGAWPQALDALAATRPDQTSGVVETRYGFHVFRRRQPPPEHVLSGVHIVIGHENAGWLPILARGPLPRRSREQALALAHELYEQAREHPERFRELVEQRSEHRDALLGGDFGSWSTREPNPFPPRMRRLEQLAPGEVGAPVETHLGFEIVQRTEAQPREQLAMRAARLPFDPEAPQEEEASRSRVLARADALARQYAAEPHRFGAPGELGTAFLQWQSGRGVPGVEAQLAQLELGAVGAAPVQAEFTFQISQRVAPQPVTASVWSSELPAPTSPDIVWHTSQMSRAAVQELLRQSAREAQAELHFPDDTLAVLNALGERPELAAEAPEAGVDGAALRQLLESARPLLGEKPHAAFLAVFQRQLAALLLGAPADSAFERGL